MDFLLKEFADLSNVELFEIYKLRSEIFIVEQNCAYQDVDETDKKAIHLMGSTSGVLAAYARVIPPGISYKEPSIGRVVVKKEFRGQQFATLLMKECIKYINSKYPGMDIVISAQSYLLKFYGSLGFIPEGEEYPEDNIPHTKMRFPKQLL